MNHVRVSWVVVAVAVGFVVGAASCGTQGRCGPTTCPAGCCDTTGRCVAGNSTTACGTKGVTCATCSLGQTCDFSGMCSGNFGAGSSGGGFSTSGGGTASTGGGLAPTGGGSSSTGGGTAGGSVRCTPVNCNGCCQGDQCLAGNTLAACGAGAQACTACTSTQTCSAGQCTGGSTGGGAPGCTNGCLSAGQCLVAGTTQQSNSRCGNNGATCFMCPAGTCTNGFCIPGGTGGGSPPVGGGSPTGGGGSTGGGPSGGGSPTGGGVACPAVVLAQAALPNASFPQEEAGYELFNGGAFNFALFAGPSGVGTSINQLRFELVRLTGSTVPVPFNGSFQAVNYAQCTACLRYEENCTPDGQSCQRYFLAQSGSVSFPTATPSATGGTFTGAVAGARLVEWNITNDVPVPSGGCRTIADAGFDSAW